MVVPGVNQNPGDTKAVTGDSGDHGITNEKATVEAVTVEDIMDRIPAQSYIIKTDIQKYDCKVINPCSIKISIYSICIPSGDFNRRPPFIGKTYSVSVHGMGHFCGCLLVPCLQTEGSWVQGLC